MTGLRVLDVGPAVAIQDLGRPGFLADGMMRGGAADPLALHEGAAMLGQSPALAALEMAGTGGTFEALKDMGVALTGSAMRASIDGTPVVWNASHLLPKGARLTIGPTLQGTYGYMSLSGGIATNPVMGGRGTHLQAGLGALLSAGEILPVGPGHIRANRTLPREARFDGGTVRIVPSVQTEIFPKAERERFEQTLFRRDPRANRQGMRLDFDGQGFGGTEGLSFVSEIVTPGDIQITGDGTPFVLLVECQTTGGYPRIGTVLPSDMPKVAQTPAGRELRFAFVSVEEGRAIEARARADLARLPQRVTALVRDPRNMPDLLDYNLISGMTAGDG